MLTLEDVLSKYVESKWAWPFKGSKSGLVDVYKKLRLTLDDGKLGMSPIHSGRSHYSANAESSKNMVIMCRNNSILKALNNKQYIYLTPTKMFMESPYLSTDRFEYVAILKREGRVGYCVLILGFKSIDYGFFSPDYEEYGGYFGLMEVLSDGTTILFGRSLPWSKVKECRANTTAIRNLFFDKDEVKSIGLIVDDALSSQHSDKNKIYTYQIGEVLCLNESDMPF